MSKFNSFYSLIAIIFISILVYSCVKESDFSKNQNETIVEYRSESNTCYDIMYIDSLGNEYFDYNEIKDRFNGGEKFMISWSDSLMLMDSVRLDTLTFDTVSPWPHVMKPCCDHLVFHGWGQTPFSPLGMIIFTLDEYSHINAVKYYKNVKIWVRSGSTWVLNYNWNWRDLPGNCEAPIYGSGLFLGNALGCPNSQKKVRLERRWVDDNGVDRLCTAVEGTFYFPGYPFSNPYF